MKLSAQQTKAPRKTPLRGIYAESFINHTLSAISHAVRLTVKTSFLKKFSVKIFNVQIFDIHQSMLYRLYLKALSAIGRLNARSSQTSFFMDTCVRSQKKLYAAPLRMTSLILSTGVITNILITMLSHKDIRTITIASWGIIALFSIIAALAHNVQWEAIQRSSLILKHKNK